jgi:hypothetical protein
MGRFDALTTLDKEPEAQMPPLPEKAAPVQTAGKPASLQTDLHANQQTSKDASKQTRKPVNMQTGKPASTQTGKQVNLQTGKQVFIEKYSSYLQHEYKRELKRIAWESDRNEYEVLIEAVEQFLAREKQRK